MSVDLRVNKSGGSWVRCFGTHEDSGFQVAINDVSAHVTITAHGILFEVEREDIPAAWNAEIDVIQLRTELLAAITRRMSPEVLEELFREFGSARQHAFWAGEKATRTKIKEALGL